MIQPTRLRWTERGFDARQVHSNFLFEVRNNWMMTNYHAWLNYQGLIKQRVLVLFVPATAQRPSSLSREFCSLATRWTTNIAETRRGCTVSPPFEVRRYRNCCPSPTSGGFEACAGTWRCLLVRGRPYRHFLPFCKSRDSRSFLTFSLF